MLTPQLQTLFKRTFVDGALDPTTRPNETELYNALEEYIKILKKRKCGHYMSTKYIGKCEWCRIRKIKDKLSM